MTDTSTVALAGRPSSEQGMAMITALLFVMIITVLAASSMAYAQHSLNTTAVDRKRTQSIGAAEAGIDLTLQSMTAVPLPCSAASTLGTGPTQSSYSVVITYYDTSGNALTCIPGTGPTTAPATALLTSTGTTNAAVYGNRVMQALVKLTAVTSGGFDKVLFANGPLTMNNNATINGLGGNNAEVYTNTSFTCTNNQMVYGVIYAQGDITASNTCSTSGDWWAKGSITATGNGAVGGNVYAAGDTTGSLGTISMGNTTVGKNAVAKGVITPTPCGAGQQIAGTCSSYAAPGDPPYEAFPVLDWNSPAWTGAGFTVVDDRGKCTGLSSQFYTDLAAMATSTTPTVFLTDCQLDWSKNTWTFNTDVAVWSSAGMDTNNRVTIQSASSAAHNFYLIVPYHVYGSTSTAVSCGPFPDGTGNIAFKNQTSIGGVTTPLNLFLYSPCGVALNNKQIQSGSVYSGQQLTITNSFTMNYDDPPVPGGAVGSPATSYSVALEYLREG